MNGGVDGMQIFRDAFDRRRFLADLQRSFEAFEVEVHAWVLMNTHYHLLLRSVNGELAPAMQMLGTRYASAFNHKYGRYGPVFRGRFTSRWIDSADYLTTAVRYVHHNPFDTGIASLADYTWSSWPAYLGLVERPDWLTTELVISHFGGRDRLIDFVDPISAAALRRAA